MNDLKTGVGISMNPCWDINKDIQDGLLVRVLADYQIDDQSAFWLVYPQSTVLSRKVRVFIDFLIEKLVYRLSWRDSPIGMGNMVVTSIHVQAVYVSGNRTGRTRPRTELEPIA